MARTLSVVLLDYEKGKAHKFVVSNSDGLCTEAIIERFCELQEIRHSSIEYMIKDFESIEVVEHGDLHDALEVGGFKRLLADSSRGIYSIQHAAKTLKKYVIEPITEIGDVDAHLEFNRNMNEVMSRIIANGPDCESYYEDWVVLFENCVFVDSENNRWQIDFDDTDDIFIRRVN